MERNGDIRRLCLDILAGAFPPAEAFEVSAADARKLADRIDSLVCPCPAHPTFLRRDLPVGWLRLVEMAITTCCWRAEQEQGSALLLLQCKEKFGELRLLFDVTGSEPLVADIAALTSWARQTSRGICAIFGTPATLTTECWIVPLSGAAIALRDRDRRQFRIRAVVPERA